MIGIDCCVQNGKILHLDRNDVEQEHLNIGEESCKGEEHTQVNVLCAEHKADIENKIYCKAVNNCQQHTGEKVNVEIEFFGDLIIKKNEIQEKKILYNGAYSYVICGILDVDDGLIKSEINFSIDRYYLYEYGYLDKEYVEIIVPRVDFYF